MTQRDELVRIALGEVGKPYSTHRDCSGLVAWLYRQIGVTIPEGSVAQEDAGSPLTGPKLLPGDLVFWGNRQADHVGLYVGNGRVVNALNEQRGIVNTPLGGDYGMPYRGARRMFLPDDSPIVEESAPVEEAWTAPTGTASPSAPSDHSGNSSSTTARPNRDGEGRTPSGKARRRQHRRRKERD